MGTIKLVINVRASLEILNYAFTALIKRVTTQSVRRACERAHNALLFVQSVTILNE